MSGRATAACAALAAGIYLTPAHAGEVAQELTWESPRALVSAGALNLRAEPSLDAATIAVLPRAWPVAVLDDSGPAVRVNGQADHWSYVATFKCADPDCETYQAGWVADSYLASDDRFAPLRDGPSGIVAGYDRQSVFAYEVSKTGAFTRWRLPCSAGSCSTAIGVAPLCAPQEELALGSVCVLSGTLHRYGGLVRGRSRNGSWLDGQDVKLSIGRAGALCHLGQTTNGGASTCAHVGEDPSGDHGPAVAIARLAAERRQRLALTAASSLNLRDQPSLSAAIVARLPMASSVERHGNRSLPVILNGRRDDWVQVTVLECAGGGCRADMTGWVMDSYLAYEDRLSAVTDWSGAERSGNTGYGFEMSPDGTFRYWEGCGTGQFGLEICSRTGRMYRYRDLFVLRDERGDIHPAFVADAGKLCVISTGLRRDPAGCES